MTLENAVEAILEQGKAEANRVLEEARNERQRMLSEVRDEAVVRKIVGDSFAGTVECAGGVVIESADETRRVDLRYETLLRDVWDDAVKEVAETLWPPEQ